MLPLVGLNLNNNYIALARATRSNFFDLKKVHISLAKVFNHIKFIRRCLDNGLTPKGLRIHVPVASLQSSQVVAVFQRRVLKSLLCELYGKKERLQRQELNLRTKVQFQVHPQEWFQMWENICCTERLMFYRTRSSHLHKFAKLLEAHHQRSSQKVYRSSYSGIVNLSNRALTKNELSLLNKGLKFVPATNKLNKFNVAAATEYAMSNAGLSDPSVTHIINSTISTPLPFKHNLSREETKALKDLKSDNTIVICNADKGNSVVILNKTDYKKKLESIIYSSDYVALKKDPSQTIDNKIRKIVRSLKKLPNSPKDIAFKLIGQNSRDPSIYGQPKIHKPNIPLRPIITNYGTVLEMSAKFVAKILKCFQQKSLLNTSITNSSKVIERLKSINLPATYTLVSFDVVNLFGSLDLNLCYKTVSEIILSDPDFQTEFNIPPDVFLEIFKICLSNSYFKYDNKFFEQKSGIAMGSPLSPVVSDLVMFTIESKIILLPEFQNILEWLRYVDDVASIWISDIPTLSIFLDKINGLNPRIQFTMEIEKDGILPFLDLKLHNSPNVIKISTHIKPTDSQLVTNFQSFQPPHVKMNILQGECTRALRNSDFPNDDSRLIKAKFIRNQYPEKLINNTLKKTSKKLANVNQLPKQTIPSSTERPKILVLPYLGKVTSKLKKRIKTFDLDLISSKQPSLADSFSHQSKYKTRKDSNVVYSISCNCGKEYIGETGKLLSSRVSQHKYAVANHMLTEHHSNGLAYHVFLTQHRIDWSSVRILVYEPMWKLRKFKEALCIKKFSPKLNLNSGSKIRGNWTCL